MRRLCLAFVGCLLFAAPAAAGSCCGYGAAAYEVQPVVPVATYRFDAPAPVGQVYVVNQGPVLSGPGLYTYTNHYGPSFVPTAYPYVGGYYGCGGGYGSCGQTYGYGWSGHGCCGQTYAYGCCGQAYGYGYYGNGGYYGTGAYYGTGGYYGGGYLGYRGYYGRRALWGYRGYAHSPLRVTHRAGPLRRY